MKTPVQYLSALAICKSKPEEVQIETPKDEATGKYRGIIKVFMAEEWQTVVSLEPLYDSAEDAKAAMTKFVNKIRLTTPYVGQRWPVENGPIPFGFVIHPDPKGERILARPSNPERKKGFPFTPARRRR